MPHFPDFHAVSFYHYTAEPRSEAVYSSTPQPRPCLLRNHKSPTLTFAPVVLLPAHKTAKFCTSPVAQPHCTIFLHLLSFPSAPANNGSACDVCSTPNLLTFPYIAYAKYVGFFRIFYPISPTVPNLFCRRTPMPRSHLFYCLTVPATAYLFRDQPPSL